MSVFRNLLQLNILCKSAVKLHYAENKKYRLRARMCTSQSLLKQKTFLQVAQTSFLLIPHSGELCRKNYIIKMSGTLFK